MRVPFFLGMVLERYIFLSRLSEGTWCCRNVEIRLTIDAVSSDKNAVVAYTAAKTLGLQLASSFVFGDV